MLTFPSLLLPNAGGYVANPKTISGGQSIGGLEQVVTSLNDRWAASYRFPANRNDRILALRAFILGMRGRSGTVALPAFDKSRAPWPLVNGVAQTPKIRRRPTLDGTPYADPPSLVDQLIIARTAAAAAAMDIQLTIAMTLGSAPQPGHLFSLGTRLYAVTSVAGAGPFVCGIWPSLRFDAAASTVVNFTSPVCEMRFSSDGEGADAMKALDQLRFGAVTLNFDEAAIST